MKSPIYFVPRPTPRSGVKSKHQLLPPSAIRYPQQQKRKKRASGQQSAVTPCPQKLEIPKRARGPKAKHATSPLATCESNQKRPSTMTKRHHMHETDEEKRKRMRKKIKNRHPQPASPAAWQGIRSTPPLQPSPHAVPRHGSQQHWPDRRSKKKKPDRLYHRIQRIAGGFHLTAARAAARRAGHVQLRSGRLAG